MTENRPQLFTFNHQPTIKNEVAKTLYPSLDGIIASLEYVEEAKESPDKNKLAFYKEISDFLMSEHRSFYKFTDKEIEYKVSILSPIIKEMVKSDESLHHEILVRNVVKIRSLSNPISETMPRD